MVRKSKESPQDGGLSSKQIKQLRSAIRQIWSWSYARRLVLKRCALPGDFARCEKCNEMVSKIFVDHIAPCGDVEDANYLKRVFKPSKFLQGLCKKCHAKKTKAERERSQW